VLTLEALESLGATAGALKVWLDDLSRYDTFLDRKLFVLGVMSILKVPLDKIPAGLRPHMKSLVHAAMKVLAELIQNPPAGIHVSGEEDEDEEGEATEHLEELLENGGYDSNEDAEDVVDDQYLAILKQLRDEADGQFGYEDDNDDDYVSLLDEVDEVEFFLGTLQNFAQAHAPEYASLELESDGAAQQLLGMFQGELQRRHEERQAAAAQQ